MQRRDAYWMKQEVPMWSTIVKALLDMKMADLALKITSKHVGKLNGGGSYMCCDVGDTSCEDYYGFAHSTFTELLKPQIDMKFLWSVIATSYVQQHCHVQSCTI